MTVLEAIRLIRELARDPGSAFAASVNEWDQPLSRESWLLMDVYDLAHAVAAGKKAVPHSWRPGAKNKGKTALAMSAGGRSRDEMLEILGRMGRVEPA